MLLAPPAAILANVVGSHRSIPVILAVLLKIEGFDCRSSQSISCKPYR